MRLPVLLPLLCASAGVAAAPAPPPQVRAPVRVESASDCCCQGRCGGGCRRALGGWLVGLGDGGSYMFPGGRRPQSTADIRHDMTELLRSGRFD